MSPLLLKNEYLDEDEIIGNIFQGMLNFSIQQNKAFSTLTEFISKTSSLLEELECSMAVPSQMTVLLGLAS